MKIKLVGIFVIMLLIAVPVLSATEPLELNNNCNNKKVNEIFNQPPIQWQKDYGYPEAGSAFFVQQTNDGGYIATGVVTTTGGTNHEVFLVKTDANGNLQWSKTYGELSIFDCGYCVQQTADDGYIIAGTYKGMELWLIKTDSNGNQQWSKIYSTPNWDSAYSVIQTSDGGYAVVGGYTNILVAPDAWVVKTDSNGNKQWDRLVGGGSFEYGHCIQETSDGGYIVAGYTDSFGAGLEDARLFKLDSVGNILWIQNYGGNLDDRGNSVRQTSDGGFIMGGFTKSFGAGQSDVYLIKTDSSGNLAWSQTYGGGGDDVGNSVRQTTDGGYTIFGTTDSYGSGGKDAYLIKTDSSGGKQWDDTYGGTGDDDGQCVQQTSDGYYILAGAKHIHTTYTQFWLIKLGISTNQPPNQPTKPSGPPSGKTGTSYTYSTSSNDPNGDEIYYWFEWGDGTNSVWLGPYISGATVSASHTWTTKGTYSIKVKAKDDPYGAESSFSAPLSVTMPRARTSSLWMQFLDMFPILQRILNFIV